MSTEFPPFRDGTLAERYPIPFKADSALDAYAVMVANGIESGRDDVIPTVDQYDGDDPRGLILINSPMAVAADGYGRAALAWPAPVFAQANGTINAGDNCGPVPGQWYLTTDHPGYVALEDAADSIVPVIKCPFAPTPFATTAEVAGTTVAGTLLDLSGSDVGISLTLRDDLGIFTGGVSGSNGWAVQIGSKYYIWQLGCPADVTTDDLRRGALWN